MDLNTLIHSLIDMGMGRWAMNAQTLPETYLNEWKHRANFEPKKPKPAEPPVLPGNLDDIFNDKKYLYIRNTAGWNHDIRSRGHEYRELFNVDYVLEGTDEEFFESNLEFKKPIWYEEWSATYFYNSQGKGLTYRDVMNGVMAVKSGKLDRCYELFCKAKMEFDDDTLVLLLDFNHGS